MCTAVVSRSNLVVDHFQKFQEEHIAGLIDLRTAIVQLEQECILNSTNTFVKPKYKSLIDN